MEANCVLLVAVFLIADVESNLMKPKNPELMIMYEPFQQARRPDSVHRQRPADMKDEPFSKRIRRDVPKSHSVFEGDIMNPMLRMKRPYIAETVEHRWSKHSDYYNPEKPVVKQSSHLRQKEQHDRIPEDWTYMNSTMYDLDSHQKSSSSKLKRLKAIKPSLSREKRVNIKENGNLNKQSSPSRTKELKEKTSLSRVKRLEKKPSLSRMKQLEETPSLSRVKRLEETPSLSRVKRLEETPSLSRVKRLEETPSLSRVKRLEEKLSLSREKRLEEKPSPFRLNRLEQNPSLEYVKRFKEKPLLPNVKRPEDEPFLSQTKQQKKKPSRYYVRRSEDRPSEYHESQLGDGMIRRL